MELGRWKGGITTTLTKQMIKTLEAGVYDIPFCFLTYVTEAWVPGQGVSIDYAAIVEILISQFDNHRKKLLLSFKNESNAYQVLNHR